ncbi:alpha/beta fold hydrolase [Kribbella sp. NPDC058245]|uniref:alpha/beta fold hydrolase n=1 Tax=Kribbella sp. NPDC058245 TaxID=3346399 RepID=UPI0036E41F49
MLTLDDHQTGLLQRGTSGPPVVLLHSLGSDKRMWELVLDQLAKGRRVFAYDLRGHGEAAGAPHPERLTDLAHDLFAVLDALELDAAHIVGLSYGGGIAQTAAVEAPERFASLALLATTDRPFPDVFEHRAAAAEAGGMEAQVEESIERWFTPEAIAAQTEGVRFAREGVRAMEPAAWAAAWRAMKTLDVQGKLASFTAPALVVAGGADLPGTADLLRSLADGIPQGQFIELPGVPHLQTLERPELIAAALDAFLPRE